jgi:hypothetical protein
MAGCPEVTDELLAYLSHSDLPPEFNMSGYCHLLNLDRDG